MAKKPSSGIVYPQAVPKAQRYTRKNYAAYVLKKVHKEMGGIPAMTQWARENPTEFYKLWGKLVPIEANMQLEDNTAHEPTTIVIEAVDVEEFKRQQGAEARRAALYKELIDGDTPDPEWEDA